MVPYIINNEIDLKICNLLKNKTLMKQDKS